MLLEETADNLDLVRLDSRTIPAGHGEVRLFATVRNEALRLPFFLRYYAAAGVDRFFIIDNRSTDGTLDFLLSFPNVHVFEAAGNYAQAGYGVLWVQLLLGQYGLDRWCVVVDADEIVVYPGAGDVSIPELCKYLDGECASALYCTLIDMYADGQLSDVLYLPGENPLSVCPYFEINTISRRGYRSPHFGGSPISNGGMRQRVFGLDVSLDKMSVFKFRPPMVLYEGMHRLSHARLSAIRGAVLHFKYLRDFGERARLEASRGQHWSNAIEYKQYAATMEQFPALNPHTRDSRLYRSWEDLMDGGILQSTKEFDAYLHSGCWRVT